MDAILEMLKAVGLPPPMLGTTVALALLLRFARGSLRWFTPGWGYGAALALGVLGAWIELPAAATRQDVAHAAAAIAVVVLCGQRALQSLAESGKVPWLPADNAWAKPDVTKEVA